MMPNSPEPGAVPVPRGDFTGVGRVDGFDFETCVERGQDLRCGHHVPRLPPVRGADVHELDEPNDVSGTPKVIRDIECRAESGVIGGTSLHDGVDLDRAQSGVDRRVDSGKHVRHVVAGVGDRAERRVLE
jgi:hypothetical protein